MAINGVIVYFPWGAGGNFVKNIINIDTQFEFIDDNPNLVEYFTKESRYNWLVNYYRQIVTPDSWLVREWSIRNKLYNRYYLNNGPGYWNPNKKLVYDCHGDKSSTEAIIEDRKLQLWDIAGVARGIKEEQISPWSLQDCHHVFLIPNDVEYITKIYNSKNPTINQFEYKEPELKNRQQLALAANKEMTENLLELHTHLTVNNKIVYKHTADDLYTENGWKLVDSILSDLGIDVATDQVKSLHSLWLDGTKQVYSNYFGSYLK